MRLLRSLGAFVALIVVGAALASSASAATTLSASANPTQGGTLASPQPTMTTLETIVDNNGATPTPIPVAQTATVVQTLPAEFASQLGRFGSCPESKFAGGSTAPGGPEDPTVACPANSLVGGGSLKLVATLGPNTIEATSDKVVIVNNSTTGGLSLWASYTVVGVRISKILPGTVSTNSAGQTVISWDPTPAEPTAPATVKLLELTTAYNANQSGLQKLEPFANTGCSAGSWAFSVVNSFVGGTPAGETAKANVACTAGAATSAPPANTAAPKISGTVRVGQSLTANVGTWTGSPAPTFTQQWELCGPGSKCTAIAGATGASYTVRSQDVGHTIRVTVKGTNPSGSASAVSAPTATVSGGTVSNKSKTLSVSAKGTGRLTLKCGGAGPCAGTYEIDAAGKSPTKKKGGKKIVLARGRYSVKAGKTATIAFRLTGSGKSLLKQRNGKLDGLLKLQPTGAKVVSSRLTITQG